MMVDQVAALFLIALFLLAVAALIKLVEFSGVAPSGSCVSPAVFSETCSVPFPGCAEVPAWMMRTDDGRPPGGQVGE